MQMIISGGHIAAILTFLLFAFLWIHEARIISRGKLGKGTIFNAAGFGVLPALAVWKVFEPYYGLKALYNGKELFTPFIPVPFMTWGGCFAPERIELAALLLSFTAIVLWLIIRKEPLPGNGDLFLTALCVWSAVRIVTETLRADPLRIQGISVFLVTSILTEITIMMIWTVQRGRKQKNAGMTALEWLGIAVCCVVVLLIDQGKLSIARPIVELTVITGCSSMMTALILSAGKDSRDTMSVTVGSDS